MPDLTLNFCDFRFKMLQIDNLRLNVLWSILLVFSSLLRRRSYSNWNEPEPTNGGQQHDLCLLLTLCRTYGRQSKQFWHRYIRSLKSQMSFIGSEFYTNNSVGFFFNYEYEAFVWDMQARLIWSFEIR